MNKLLQHEKRPRNKYGFAIFSGLDDSSRSSNRSETSILKQIGCVLKYLINRKVICR